MEGYNMAIVIQYYSKERRFVRIPGKTKTVSSEFSVRHFPPVTKFTGFFSTYLNCHTGKMYYYHTKNGHKPFPSRDKIYIWNVYL